jgi:membrane-associated protein TcaA
MSVCQNCGESVEPQQTFCKNCGAKINPESQMRSTVQKQGIPNRIKWIILAAIVLVICVFAGHFYLSNLYKPEKTIAMFEQAVKQKDYRTLRKVLSQEGAQITLSDKELNNYISYVTKDKKLDEIVNELKQNAAGIKQYKKLTPVKDSSGNNLVELGMGPKKFGIYQQYDIKAFPFTIKADSNLDNTEIYFNGKKVKTLKSRNDSVTIGKFLPGDYSIKAIYKGDYVNLNADKKVDFSEANNNIVTTDIKIDGHFVSIYSNGENAEIFANGKDTGKKVEEIDSFGPVPTDGSVEVYAVLSRDSGPIKSDAVKIKDDSEVFLEFKEIADEAKAQEAKQQAQATLDQYGSSYDSTLDKMQKFMDEYLTESVQAINQRDFSYVEAYLSPAGESYKTSKDYIDYLAGKGITEDFISVNVVNVEITGAGFKVKTREEFNINKQDASSNRKVYESNYTIDAGAVGLKINKLDSTKEISSEDLYSSSYD